MQYHVLREKGTEPPNTGEYNKGDFAGGHFACRACGAKLYRCRPSRAWPLTMINLCGASTHVAVARVRGVRSAT